MKKNIIFTLFGIMCATGAVTTDSIAACDVCATEGLNEVQDTKGDLPWDDTSSANGQYAHQLVFWKNCDKHENETISYYKCDTTNDRKCIYGRAKVDITGAYPARIDDTDDTIEERLICCDATAGKWKEIESRRNWTGIARTGCTEVIAANCPINNKAPIFRAGDYFSSTSCLETAADNDTEVEDQSPSETYTRPANCPASANKCLTNVHTDATLFANAQGATAAWDSHAKRSEPELRVMYWKNCFTETETACFESYGCNTTNDKKFIYAPLSRDQKTGEADGEGAYAYKIVGSFDPDQYELLYCDASQNKWIKLTKADANDDNTTSYQPITAGDMTLYVSSKENISTATLWSTAQAPATQDEIDDDEDEDEDDDEEVEDACQSYSTKIQAINNAMTTLNAFKYKDDTSVWTTAEGKFNTARLGTDIASGIAMGLTGGLVSNVIIKNKQIKQGFQGYQCTVDSNIIADYGDEFVIDLAY